MDTKLATTPGSDLILGHNARDPALPEQCVRLECFAAPLSLDPTYYVLRNISEAVAGDHRWPMLRIT